MSNEDYDVKMELLGLLGVYMKDRDAAELLHELSPVMHDPNDGPELVRLMQKWLAVT